MSFSIHDMWLRAYSKDAKFHTSKKKKSEFIDTNGEFSTLNPV